MKGRSFSIAIFAIILVGVALFISKSRQVEKRHFFINETSDHRFDESIRVSILGADQRTGLQNAVVISNRTNESGQLEKIAAQTFKDLRLGEGNKGRAILYYFNPAEKALKIEVGYALEGVLPDITVRGLEMAAKSFIFTNRYQDFWAELINTLNIEIQYKERGEQSLSEGFDFTQYRFLSGGGGTLSNSYDRTWTQMMKERSKIPLNRSVYQAQKSPEEALNLYLQSLHAGRYESDLDFLTTESQFFRSVTPHTSYQMYRNARMYERAGLDRLIQDGTFAWAFFKKNNPVLPLVFRQEKGLWKVHEPFSWSLFQRFEDSNQVFLKFPLIFESVELMGYLNQEMGRPLYHLTTPLKAEFLRTPVKDSTNFREDLIHLYWIDRAEAEITKMDAHQLSNDDLLMAADVYNNLGLFSSFRKIYAIIAQRFPQDSIVQKNWQFYQEALNLRDQDWVLHRPN